MDQIQSNNSYWMAIEFVVDFLCRKCSYFFISSLSLCIGSYTIFFCVCRILKWHRCHFLLLLAAFGCHKTCTQYCTICEKYFKISQPKNAAAQYYDNENSSTTFCSLLCFFVVVCCFCRDKSESVRKRAVNWMMLEFRSLFWTLKYLGFVACIQYITLLSILLSI